MNPWDVPHQAAGSPEPSADPNKVMVYNMRFCPYAQRTILTLLAKEIPFEVVNINLKSKPEWFLKNTWGTVSVVRYKGQHVMESLVNSDFIDEEFPEKQLHPKNPLEKAQGRLRVEKFGKITGPFYKIAWLPSTKEERQEAWKTLTSKLEEMDKELGDLGTPFFGGDNPNMTDYMLWPWNERLPMLNVIWPDEDYSLQTSSLQNYQRWVQSMLQDAAVKQYALSTDNHMEFRKQMMSSPVNYDFLLN